MAEETNREDTETSPEDNPSTDFMSTPTPPTPPTPPTEPASKTEPAPYWPEDWREKYAGDNEKILNRLKRFDSPKAAIDSWFAADKKISQGLAPLKLSPDATPEQIAEYRKASGVPENPAEYVNHLALKEGLVIGEDDRAVIGEFMKSAHGANMTPDQVSKAINWYYDTREAQANEQYERDLAAKEQYDTELRAEWGPQYKRNLAAIRGLLNEAPEGVADGILGGRLSDGTPLGNHPATLRWLANIAMELNPAATVVPGAGTNSMSQIDSEIAAIEKRMGGTREERKAYFDDEAAQARYRDLITAKERMAGR